MLPPDELKNQTFTRVMRGYNPDEVNEHVDFMIEKYAELYRENDRLERKLKTVTAQYEVLRRDEEGIRNALINAQRAGATIVSEANERAEVIMRAAKTNCDKVLDDFRAESRAEREKFTQLQAAAESFKETLFRTYQQHIDMISAITVGADQTVADASEEQLVRRVIDSTKESIAILSASEKATDERVIVSSEEEYPNDLDLPLEEEKASDSDNTPYLNEIFNHPADAEEPAAQPIPAQPVSSQPIPAQPVSSQPIPVQPVPAREGKTPNAVLSLGDVMDDAEDGREEAGKTEQDAAVAAKLLRKDIFAPDPVEETLAQVRGKPGNPDGILASVRSLNSQIRHESDGANGTNPAAVSAEQASGPVSDDEDYLEFIRNVSGEEPAEAPQSKNERRGKKGKDEDFDSFLHDLKHNK